MSKKTFFNRLEKGLKIILGTEVSVGDVVYCIEEAKITHNDLNSISKVERLIATAIKTCFEDVQSKYKVDEELGLKVSIDIGEEVGIMCQLARGLTKNKLISLIGRAVYLNHKVYRNKLVLLIIGDNMMQKTPIVKELQQIMENVGVNFYYLVVADK